MVVTENQTKEQLTKEFFNKEKHDLRSYEKYFNDLLKVDWVVNGKVYNLNELGCKFKFNNRKRALGVCKSRLFKVIHVAISKPTLLSNIDNKNLWDDVIKHEIAHALDVVAFGTTSHDNRWKRMCLITGADPKRTKDSSSIVTNHKYELRCPNDDCDVVNKYHRKPKVNKACGSCCRKYNNSRFDEKYLLKLFKVG